jgi:hypothetical protein
MSYPVTATFAVVPLLGVTLAAALAGYRAPITLYLPYVEGLVAIRLEVAIDGRRVGVIEADKRKLTAEPSLQFSLDRGFHRYTLGGHVDMQNRRQMIAGSGIIVSQEYLTEALESPSAAGDPLAALEALLREYRAVAGAAERLPRLERRQAGSWPLDIAAAEKRLNVPLPATYRRLLELYGPFAYVVPDDDGGEEHGAAVYAPDAIFPVPEWRKRVRNAPLEEGDTPRARQRLATLARDVVIGTILDTVWTVRAGSLRPCPDGTPSLNGEFLYETEPGEDLWNDDTDQHTSYFGESQPACGDRLSLLQEHITAAFIDGFEKRTALARDGKLRPRHDEDASRAGVVRLSFGEY